MIILLNGCINAGKTTVAKSLMKRSMGFAHIEVDTLRDFIRWMPLEQSIELNLKNAIAVAKNFDDANIHSVISYPLSEDNVNFINTLLVGTSIDVHAITLYPGIDKLKINRGARELTKWEVERIDVLHAAGLAKPCFGTIVDNSQQTVEETIDRILQIVGV